MVLIWPKELIACTSVLTFGKGRISVVEVCKIAPLYYLLSGNGLSISTRSSLHPLIIFIWIKNLPWSSIGLLLTTASFTDPRYRYPTNPITGDFFIGESNVSMLCLPPPLPPFAIEIMTSVTPIRTAWSCGPLRNRKWTTALSFCEIIWFHAHLADVPQSGSSSPLCTVVYISHWQASRQSCVKHQETSPTQTWWTSPWPWSPSVCSGKNVFFICLRVVQLRDNT